MEETNRRVAKRPTPDVRRWAQLYKNAARAAYLSLQPHHNDIFIKLGALTTLVGSPDSTEGREVFYALKTLFLHYRRIPRWDKAIDAIPPTSQAVSRIQSCCQAYGTYADPKGHTPLNRTPFILDTVVSVMAQVRDPDAYVRHLVKDGFYRPNGIFHPNTLRTTEKKLRGALSPTGSRLRKDHLAQIMSKVSVVRN